MGGVMADNYRNKDGAPMRACGDDPAARVACAARLGVGLKYTTLAERNELACAALDLGVTVRLVQHEGEPVKPRKAGRR